MYPDPHIPDFTPLAQTLALRISPWPDEREDLVQAALWALVEAWRRADRIDTPYGFAKRVMRCEMLDQRVRGLRQEKRTVPLTPPAPHAKALTPVPVVHSNPDADLLLQQYLQALEGGCGTTARLIAETLLTPGPTFGEYVLAEVRRKSQRAGGRPARGIKVRVRWSQRTVRQALHLRPRQWEKEMAAIRQFTRQWLARQVA